MKFLRRFSSTERDAAIVLVLVIIASVVLFPYLSEQDRVGASYGFHVQSPRFQNSKFFDERSGKAGYIIQKLSPFDPNTASESQLLSLGLSQRQVRNLLKYRSRGGRFRVKEDFARLYGLTLEKYRQLEPYIAIAPEVMAADVVKREKSNQNIQNIPNTLNPPITPIPPNSNPPKKLRFGETVDINTADTAMLKRIPGIGDYFAMRIVELRKRKQAFTSPEELLTIRDIPETALTYMTASQDFPAIYVNCWSQKELASHPLLNYAQARDIVSLRRISGAIKDVADLVALPSFRTFSIDRISSLLRYDTLK